MKTFPTFRALVLTTLGLFLFTLPTVGATAQTVEYGIAAKYPYDQGINNDPAVLKSSGFEDTNWTTGLGYSGGISRGVSRTTTTSYSGTASLQYTHTAGTHNGGQMAIHGFTAPAATYIRWYRRFDTGYNFSCQVKGDGLYAVAPGADSNADANNKPTGSDKYSLKIQYRRDSATGKGDPQLYTYHPEQSEGWGDTKAQNIGTRTLINPDQWYAYELMLKPNTVGQRNGELKFWIDGVLKAHYTGMRFRDTASLKINQLDLGAYVGGSCTAPKNQYAWDDNLVVATQYIGPMVKSAWGRLVTR
jgi:hypothetical protein